MIEQDMMARLQAFIDKYEHKPPQLIMGWKAYIRYVMESKGAYPSAGSLPQEYLGVPIRVEPTIGEDMFLFPAEQV